MHPSDIIKNVKNLSGMRVVFINMPLRETALPNNTPQGILLLATNLRDNYNVDSSVIDLNAYRIKDKQAEIKGLTNGRHLTLKETYNLIDFHFKVNKEPDLVCFSGMITTLKWQQEAAKIIRQILPDVFLVSGNGLATELKTGLFTYIPELDAVAHSEGDDVIVKICYDAKLIKEKGIDKAILSGKLQPYYLGKNGRHRFMYEGNRPKDLNNIPFADLDFLKEDVYGNNLLEYYLGNAIWGASANNSSATSFEMVRSSGFVSSRGCPYACSFCYRGSQGERNYGMRTAEDISKEFEIHVNNYGVDFIAFPDDNFAVNYQRCFDIVPYLKPMGIKWGTHLRLDESAGLKPLKNGESKFETPLRINGMAAAGCVYIGFGAESASEKVLTSMNKGGFILKNGTEKIKVEGKYYNFPKTMIYGIKNCEYAGIHANCTWILGYPNEQLEDLKTSVAFIKWQEDFYTSQGKSKDSVNMKMFTATFYPGTSMGNHPKVRGILENVFNLKFKNNHPVCDNAFYKYLIELDDATKLLYNPKTKEPLNFGEMPNETFIKARSLADEGKLYEILDS